MDDYSNYKQYHSDDPIYAASTLSKWETIKQHWHDYYEIEFIYEGEGIININGKDFPFKDGTIHFVTPTDFHSYTFFKSTQIKKIHFSDFILNPCSVANSVFNSGIKIMQIPSEQFKWINSLFDKAIYEYETNSPYKQEYIMYAINLIFMEFAKETNIKALPTNDINTPIHYICTHFREDLTLESVAKITGLSSNYFCSKFKKITGMTFKQFLTDQRLAYAVRLLSSTNLSVTEIAMTSGFNSVSYFLKVFVGKYKMTPKEYKKKLM
ncbi:MAG: helix-turn-helix domain-containing protein [Ruminococcaceae bacterium]|nr:helix-turn-helix domain-containing protein [Oscillospiraceae bacterium]